MKLASVDELQAAARAWAADDPDPATRAELEALMVARDERGLRSRMEPPLTFGTAGLRGVVGAGPAYMNRAVVMRTTCALAAYLRDHEPRATRDGVVLGHDARHSSRALAEATAGVLVSAGIPVHYFEVPVPTPLVAYAILELRAVAGIVITASHNPAEYNGYKLYAGNGVQIVPPVDAVIEAGIERSGAASAIPTVIGAFSGAHPLAKAAPRDLGERYLAAISALRPHTEADRTLRIVYTPMHGVGGRWALAALARAGFPNVSTVPAQAEPDGDFPTVAFPNPEEPGALRLALDLARSSHADLVLANDPDADRLAVGVRDEQGQWVALTGNQIGVLLGDFLLARAPAQPAPFVVSTLVSSPMLADIARSYGARHETTLTGFKWIQTAALAVTERESLAFVFGYEEAIGFSVGRVVRDKDGLSAALVFAELAAHFRAAGQSVYARLLALYVAHGLWVSAQKSITRHGPEGAREIAEATDRLTRSPPKGVAGHAVTRVVDFRKGAEERPPWLGATPLVLLDLGGAGRVLVRPSGTEPKLKIYVDLRGTTSASAVAVDQQRLQEAARSAAEEVASLLEL